MGRTRSWQPFHLSPRSFSWGLGTDAGPGPAFLGAEAGPGRGVCGNWEPYLEKSRSGDALQAELVVRTFPSAKVSCCVAFSFGETRAWHTNPVGGRGTSVCLPALYFLNIYFCERKRARMRARGGGEERPDQRLRSRPCPVSAEPRLWLKLTKWSSGPEPKSEV